MVFALQTNVTMGSCKAHPKMHVQVLNKVCAQLHIESCCTTSAKCINIILFGMSCWEWNVYNDWLYYTLAFALVHFIGCSLLYFERRTSCWWADKPSTDPNLQTEISHIHSNMHVQSLARGPTTAPWSHLHRPTASANNYSEKDAIQQHDLFWYTFHLNGHWSTSSL